VPTLVIGATAVKRFLACLIKGIAAERNLLCLSHPGFIHEKVVDRYEIRTGAAAALKHPARMGGYPIDLFSGVRYYI
jgi:hypothetical protein